MFFENTFSDYLRFLMALAILLIESFARLVLRIFPVSFLDYLRFNLIGLFPLVFRPSVEQFTDSKTMIKKQNMKFEQHSVQTDDGFYLVLHRIPKKGGKPVLFLHGCMMTSEAFLTHEDSLPFRLSRAGYDVWLGNYRGNKYSWRHKFLSPTSNQYWDFSLDEIIHFDIPAMIQLVLRRSKQEKISIVGFSQGTATPIACLSVHPEFQLKVDKLIGLASTTKPSPIGNNFIGSIMNSSPEMLYILFGRRAFMKSVLFWQNMLSGRNYKSLLDYSMKKIFGWSMKNIKDEDFQVYTHLYSHTSVKLIVHWFQIIKQGFQMHRDNNLSRGHHSLQFPVDQISTDMFLFYGGSDCLANPPQLKELNAQVFQIDDFEHLDFLWGDTSRLYDKIVALLK